MEENINLIEKILSGSASDMEMENFNSWLSESEQNKIYFEKIKLLWDKSDGVYSTIEFDKVAAKARIHLKIAERRKNTGKEKTNRFWFSTAAAILLVIGLGFIINKFNSKPDDYIEYSTRNTVKEFILADSSHIWLNSNSSLKVPKVFQKKLRKVTLRGEAYFEIARDETKPFRILTGNTISEVLGTTFNIAMDTLSGNVNIIVNTGKVAFYYSVNKRNKEILLAGNRAIFSMQDQSIKVTSNADLNYLSWKTGTLKFYNTPIDQVCNELSMHFNKKVISTIKANELKLTGTFQSDSLEEILATIELTLEVHVSKLNNEYCIEN